MRVLVTGHRGYIGTVLCPMLVNAGHSIVGLDTGFFEACNLTNVKNSFPEIRKDIRLITLEDLKDFDAVIHLASLSNDSLGDIDPELTHDINITATVNLARLTKHAGVKRFLYSSSCSVYGASADKFLDENSSLKPVSYYAESKIKSEEELTKLASPDFSPTFLRNSTAYGYSPSFRIDLVLNKLVARAFTIGKIMVIGSGNAWRPIIHIEDISRAFLLCLVADRKLIHNQAINVGINSENFTIKDLASLVKKIVPTAEIEFVRKDEPDPRSYRVNFDKLSSILPEFSNRWTALLGAQQLYDTYYFSNLQSDEVDGRKYNRLEHIKYLLEKQLVDEKLYWRKND